MLAEALHVSSICNPCDVLSTPVGDNILPGSQYADGSHINFGEPGSSALISPALISWEHEGLLSLPCTYFLKTGDGFGPSRDCRKCLCIVNGPHILKFKYGDMNMGREKSVPVKDTDSKGEPNETLKGRIQGASCWELSPFEIQEINHWRPSSTW